MIEAIDGARKQILSSPSSGRATSRAALQGPADRGGRPRRGGYRIYDGFANLVFLPVFKRFPPSVQALRYPVYAAGWRRFDLRRYGRDHRKILVVDDRSASSAATTSVPAYATEWRDTHVRITGPGGGPQRAFADFWNLNRRKRMGRSERPLLLETASTWESTIRFHRNVPILWMFPIRAMYLEAINRSSRNVWMTCAYFIPDQDFVDALKDASRAGSTYAS